MAKLAEASWQLVYCELVMALISYEVCPIGLLQNFINLQDKVLDSVLRPFNYVFTLHPQRLELPNEWISDLKVNFPGFSSFTAIVALLHI